MRYALGDIVLAKLLDPDKNDCDDPHPAVVFRTSEHDPSFWVIGITSSFRQPIPWYWMPMPWDDGGHSITGLYKPCVLKANWTDLCEPSLVIKKMGTVVDAQQFKQIVELVTSYIRFTRQQANLSQE